MFVQVIQGQVSDPEPVRVALRRWMQELSPGATGWLGSTAGVTDDGRLVATARFDSEEAARRNSDRPEQGEWWAETAKLFTGDVTFRDSVNAHAFTSGEPDKAGFVQVIQGRSSDVARASELMRQDAPMVTSLRPEILGMVLAEHDGGGYTTLGYFASEQAAREGERREPPAELKERMAEVDRLEIGTPEYFDLKEPWLYSP